MKFNFYSMALLCLFSFFLSVSGNAQKIKYGKVSQSDLKMTSYEKDPDAEALILFDGQDLEFLYNNDKGFQFQIKRHIRIKIFDKSAAGFADFPIILYSDGGRVEKLNSFKATTFNLVNGKVEKEKIGMKETFKTPMDRFRTKISYAIPNVKEGTVIDITYTVISDFLYQLTTWSYQNNIPVVKSEFFAEIPEYFIYKTVAKGYERSSITKNDISHGQGSLTLRYTNSPGTTHATGRITETSTLNYQTKKYNWEAEHVPAFKEEPLMAAAQNYISSIEFELSGTDFPSSYKKNFNVSWEDVRYGLMYDIEFGGRLKKSRPVKSIVEGLTAGLESKEEKIGVIYHYVQNNYRWNGKFSHYPRTSTQEVLNQKEGYSSDINFLVMQMLRAADIETYPVSISTRSNGFINPVQPRISQFNHVIVAVKSGDSFLLMDATDGNAPIGLLPEYDLNDRGRLFTDTYSDWISLNPTKKYKTATMAKVAIDENGELQGSVNLLLYDYAAKEFREEASFSDSKDNSSKVFLTSNSKEIEEGLEVTGTKIEKEDIYKKITASYDVKIQEKAFANGDLIYLEPMLFFGLKENPFPTETRKFPIDLTQPIEETFVLQLTLPEGYVVEELPENISFALPNKGGRYLYEYRKVNDQLIQLTSRMTISKTFFLPDAYPPLREFFNLILEKQGAQIVLKKT